MQTAQLGWLIGHLPDRFNAVAAQTAKKTMGWVSRNIMSKIHTIQTISQTPSIIKLLVPLSYTSVYKAISPSA